MISTLNKDNFTFSFPIFFNFLLLPHCSCWCFQHNIEEGWEKQIAIFYFSGTTSSFSPFRIILAVNLIYIAFIVLIYVHYSPIFFLDSYHEGMLHFVQDFFSICQDDCVIVVFKCFSVVYLIYYLCMLKHPSVSWIKSI